MLPAAAGSHTGAQGSGKAVAPARPPHRTAFPGLVHSLARTPHSQAKSNTASTAPAHCWGLPGRGWP